METQQAYQLEASQAKFANMHIAPMKVNPADLLGTIVPFNAADGKPGQAYLFLQKRNQTSG